MRISKKERKRVLKKALALVLVLAFTLAPVLAFAEVWNDPGGVAVTGTSQTIEFPRAFEDVAVLNDDETLSLYIRLFWCGETPGVAVARVDFNTGNLEIKATKSRSFSLNEWERTNYIGYCAISLIASGAGPATVRVEGK